MYSLVIICDNLSSIQIYGLTLSPLEKLMFGSRVEAIKKETKELFSSVNPNLKSTMLQDMVLIFPGAGGADDLTSELESKIKNCDEIAQLKNAPRFIQVWDWKQFRGSVMSAAFDGEAVGEAVAEAIFCNDFLKGQIRSIHSIGISVGGFAGHAFAKQCKILSGSQTHVRLTLLDPFCSRGLLGLGYGAKYFGQGVDYAEQYLNTDDPVPTTNDPLPLCAVFDITKAKERSSFVPPEGDSMHSWPVAYFARYAYQTQLENNGNVLLLNHGDLGTSNRGDIQQL